MNSINFKSPLNESFSIPENEYDGYIPSEIQIITSKGSMPLPPSASTTLQEMTDLEFKGFQLELKALARESFPSKMSIDLFRKALPTTSF